MARKSSLGGNEEEEELGNDEEGQEQHGQCIT